MNRDRKEVIRRMDQILGQEMTREASQNASRCSSASVIAKVKYT